MAAAQNYVTGGESPELLKPFHQRASEAEERLSRLEAALASKTDGASSELTEVSELKSKLEEVTAELAFERLKAQKLAVENEKHQYRINHLVRTVKDLSECKLADDEEGFHQQQNSHWEQVQQWNTDRLQWQQQQEEHYRDNLVWQRSIDRQLDDLHISHEREWAAQRQRDAARDQRELVRDQLATVRHDEIADLLRAFHRDHPGAPPPSD